MSQTFGSNTLLMHGLLFCRTVKRLTLLGLATNLRGNPWRLKALRRWTVAFTHARGSTDLDPYPSDSKLSSLVSHTIQTCSIIWTKMSKRRLNFEAHYLFCNTILWDIVDSYGKYNFLSSEVVSPVVTTSAKVHVYMTSPYRKKCVVIKSVPWDLSSTILLPTENIKGYRVV